MRDALRRAAKVLGLVALSTLAALVVTAARRRRARPGPEGFSRPPVPWPPLGGRDSPGPHGEVHTLERDQVPDDAGTHEAGDSRAAGHEAARPAGEAPGPWVEPVDGSCPEGHPVKVKVTSGIFHVPGGASYDRTVPDRCYSSADAARADGFRAAKR